jgi:D-alanyl-D-alanine carboxypeptidase/D-alanyl-D-alanine-endopeptidase (penicillin-binding protein 4)
MLAGLLLPAAAALAQVAAPATDPASAAAGPGATAPAANTPSVTLQPAAELPATVRQALAQAQIPREALAAVVLPVSGGAPRLSWQPHLPMNPASLAKLLTTSAALDLLGPAHAWRTPVWIQGRVQHGVLYGALHIQGSGDPRLGVDRLTALLRRVQQWGVKRIHGDIVLDRSLFAPPAQQPADFDGEPLKLHNVQPDALLLGYKAVIYTFTPDPAAGVAHVQVEPALAGLKVQATVPLAAGACGDWRTQLQATPQDPGQMRLAGSYPAACGERHWPLAFAEPAGYAARLLQATWRELGGRLEGTVREGPAPANTPPSFVLEGPSVAEVVRDINKLSNNVAAQQLFLTLAAVKRPGQPATEAAARELLRDWLAQRTGELATQAVLDNGSGLSRSQRVSAALLAELLRQAWAAPWMPELLASLPLNGTDGTLRRWSATPARAHLKTGSLRDVAAVAGYVHGVGGQRLILVALVQHANAPAARPVLDALLQWTIDGAPGAP